MNSNDSSHLTRSVQGILSRNKVQASAPCRIDSGGTWDIKALALPLERIGPATINVALNLRTIVTLSPYRDGVKISSQGFPDPQVFHGNEPPIVPPFGLFFAAVSYFGFSGISIHISSPSPVKSSLGGSSTALVVLVKALAKLSVRLGDKNLTKREILHLSYHLEDAVTGGNCGLQDQAAAVYGGVNQWKWHYGRRILFEKTSLLDQKGQKELSKRLLVAYCGKSHVAAHTNRKWIADFLSGRTRAGWIKANEIVHLMAQAIKEQQWDYAAGLLQEEMALRRELTPEALIPITEKLLRQAEKAGCGARFAGAGSGGSVWALGRLEDINRLRKKWEDTLTPISGGKLLDCKVDPAGVK